MELLTTRDTPRFFLFGAGNRPKWIYRGGALTNVHTGERAFACAVREERVDPAAYRVTLVDAGGERIVVEEDEAGLWVTRGGMREALAQSPVCLPEFAGHPHRELLRVLHHEILTSIVRGAPVPNVLVYPKPWLRDGALVAMVLQKTGNLHLIRDWVGGLREPYDGNNAGEREPDNLGQALVLIALAGDRAHPLVPVILEEARRLDQGGYLSGRTDFGSHPVYQTAWLRLGLRLLNLPGDWGLPRVEDSYAGLCWWDPPTWEIRPCFQEGPSAARYPYLAWAEAHTLGLPPPWHLMGANYPRTWESHASQADYAGMVAADPELAAQRTCAPHTWHAAEMFLTLAEEESERS